MAIRCDSNGMIWSLSNTFIDDVDAPFIACCCESSSSSVSQSSSSSKSGTSESFSSSSSESPTSQTSMSLSSISAESDSSSSPKSESSQSRSSSSTQTDESSSYSICEPVYDGVWPPTSYPANGLLETYTITYTIKWDWYYYYGTNRGSQTWTYTDTVVASTRQLYGYCAPAYAYNIHYCIATDRTLLFPFGYIRPGLRAILNTQGVCAWVAEISFADFNQYSVCGLKFDGFDPTGSYTTTDYRGWTGNCTVEGPSPWNFDNGVNKYRVTISSVSVS